MRCSETHPCTPYTPYTLRRTHEAHTTQFCVIWECSLAWYSAQTAIQTQNIRVYAGISTQTRHIHPTTRLAHAIASSYPATSEAKKTHTRFQPVCCCCVCALCVRTRACFATPPHSTTSHRRGRASPNRPNRTEPNIALWFMCCGAAAAAAAARLGTATQAESVVPHNAQNPISLLYRPSRVRRYRPTNQPHHHQQQQQLYSTLKPPLGCVYCVCESV